MAKQAFIMLGGNLSQTSFSTKALSRSEIIIAADGGSEKLLEKKIIPDVVIGDFDSVSYKRLEKNYHNIELKRFPKKKNYTDAQLAFEEAIKRGFRKITVAGFLGDRVDHMIANLHLIYFYFNRGIDIVCIEGKSTIRFCRGRIKIKGKKGDIVSLIPWCSEAQFVSSVGLQYCLDNLILPLGQSRGISNVMTGGSAEIKIKNGKAMVVHTTNLKNFD